MPDSRTARVLSIDGGGTRGIGAAKWLDMYCSYANILSDELWKVFDVITGTSVGGIQAMGYAKGITPATLRAFFREDGPWIFSTSSIVPGVRSNIYDKVATMVLGGSFYSNANLIAKLNEEFGNLTLTDMKTNVIAPAYRVETDSPIYFSNTNFPGSFGQTSFVKDVALATASAPLFFPAAAIGGYHYQDGGTFQNNPANIGLSVAKYLKPQANRFCVLSIGTGVGDIGFDKDPPPPPEPAPGDPPAKPYFENMAKLYKQISIGIKGPQEAVHQDLKIRSEYNLQEKLYYYRVQPILDPGVDSELDNATSAYLDYLENAFAQHFNDDANNRANFTGHLML